LVHRENMPPQFTRVSRVGLCIYGVSDCCIARW